MRSLDWSLIDLFIIIARVELSSLRDSIDASILSFRSDISNHHLFSEEHTKLGETTHEENICCCSLPGGTDWSSNPSRRGLGSVGKSVFHSICTEDRRLKFGDDIIQQHIPPNWKNRTSRFSKNTHAERDGSSMNDETWNQVHAPPLMRTTNTSWPSILRSHRLNVRYRLTMPSNMSDTQTTDSLTLSYKIQKIASRSCEYWAINFEK